jgi:hypothetical protein
MKGHPLQAAHAKGRQPVVVLQVRKAALNGGAAAVKAAEPLAVTRDAREVATAESYRNGWLLAASPTERDYRLAAAFLNLGIDPVVVVALVGGDCLGLDAASADRIEQRGDEVRLAAALAGADGRTVAPGSIRVAEPFALPTVLADVAHPVCECREVGSVYRYVTSKIRVPFAQGFGAGIKALDQGGSVLPQLDREPVASPTARRATEYGLQSRMLRDQRRNHRPSRQSEQGFDEARADESAST